MILSRFVALSVSLIQKVSLFQAKVVKWAAFCRGGGGGARDHLVLDTVQLKPVEGGSCTSSAAQPPGDPVAYEFYFGTAIPGSAGDGALLDDGTGYASGRSAGLTFGWNCDGNPDVDFSGGRRGLGRDGGLGINHFDRNGECPGPVNWEIEVPNGQCTSLARVCRHVPRVTLAAFRHRIRRLR